MTLYCSFGKGCRTASVKRMSFRRNSFLFRSFSHAHRRFNHSVSVEPIKYHCRVSWFTRPIKSMISFGFNCGINSVRTPFLEVGCISACTFSAPSTCFPVSPLSRLQIINSEGLSSRLYKLSKLPISSPFFALHWTKLARSSARSISLFTL